jgi:hypothetical protein
MQLASECVRYTLKGHGLERGEGWGGMGGGGRGAHAEADRMRSLNPLHTPLHHQPSPQAVRNSQTSELWRLSYTAYAYNHS